MTSDRKGDAIMVAGDNSADVEEVRKVLAADFARVDVSLSAEQDVADFDRLQPRVIVLAFREIAKAQAWYVHLLRLSPLAHLHPHRTVLLCGREQAKEAFSLCKRATFDDYALFWPQAYDGHRLGMSVWIACRDLGARTSDGPSPAQLALHASRVEAMEDVLGKQVAEGKRHAAAVMKEGPQPIVEWASQLDSKVAPHLHGVRELAQQVRAMRPLVMVVEDDAFAAKLIGKALDAEPWDVVFATDAPSALALLQRARPKALLMDVNLPGMNGLELTQKLKATPSLAAIPVLMLTGEARRDVLEKSLAAGATGFIVKPFTREGLLARLAPLMA